MAAILDAILNFRVTIACWKGCPPRSCCRRSKESNDIWQPLQQTMSVFTKIGWFASWV